MILQSFGDLKSAACRCKSFAIAIEILNRQCRSLLSSIKYRGRLSNNVGSSSGGDWSEDILICLVALLLSGLSVLPVQSQGPILQFLDEELLPDCLDQRVQVLLLLYVRVHGAEIKVSAVNLHEDSWPVPLIIATASANHYSLPSQRKQQQ